MFAALAQGQSRRSLSQDVKHVVILMQENRSFDHYFGTLSGVRGFDDASALKLPDGRSVFHQPDSLHPNGYLLPFHSDTGASSAQKIPSTSDAWAVQHEARNGGRMDQWLPAHRKAHGAKAPYVMSYYKREDIPFQFALADAFTICDAYHCSVMGPTYPNRMYLMTGMIDPDSSGRGPIASNSPLRARTNIVSGGSGPTARTPAALARSMAGAITSICSVPSRPPSPACGFRAATPMRGSVRMRRSMTLT